MVKGIQAKEGGGPSDRFLTAGIANGDEAALRVLIDRYDRLVRYTVLRLSRVQCLRDPQWLDSVSSTTWAGFVQSVRMGSGAKADSTAAYLVRIAKNKTVDALRAYPTESGELSAYALDDRLDAFPVEPENLIAQLEELETLNDCLGELDEEEKCMVSQLSLVIGRRWREAAAALGIPESTLRSRWHSLLELLRARMEEKLGLELAPRIESSDL